MAFTHGSKATVTVATKDLTQYIDSAELVLDVDTAQGKTFGQTWTVTKVGHVSGKFEISGMFDAAIDGPSDTLVPLVGAAPVAVQYKPDGAETRTFNAAVASYSESSPVGGLVAWKASLVIDGVVTAV